MKTAKYTRDGRKVVIVGTLNSDEFICQEIFETDSGDEIPGGERFTANALFDEPVKSSKERTLERLDDRIRTSTEEIERLVKRKKDALLRCKAQEEIAHNAVMSIKSLENKADSLESFIKFLSGSVNWVVTKSWQKMELLEFTHAVTSKSEWGTFHSLKLVSLFGSSKGNLSYRLSKYSDGSDGGSGKEVVPFETKEGALAYIRDYALELIQNDDMSIKFFDYCVGLGIELDPTVKHKLVVKSVVKQNAELDEIIKEKTKAIAATWKELESVENLETPQDLETPQNLNRRRP